MLFYNSNLIRGIFSSYKKGNTCFKICVFNVQRFSFLEVTLIISRSSEPACARTVINLPCGFCFALPDFEYMCEYVYLHRTVSKRVITLYCSEFNTSLTLYY